MLAVVNVEYWYILEILRYFCQLYWADDNINEANDSHSVKSVRIRSYSGTYFSRIRTEYGEILQNNSEYEQFSRNEPLSRS